MQRAGFPPSLLVTFDPVLGAKRHSDYVDVGCNAGQETDVLLVENVNTDEVLQKISAEQPDVIFVIGWSQLVDQRLRSLARRFVVGYHPAALPALRGRAVLGWTIILGLKATGSTLFLIDDGVDSGPILAQQLFELDSRETVTTLGAKHMVALGEMLKDLLPKLANGSAEPCDQPAERVSYCARRTAHDSLIDWHEPAEAVDRLVRASARPYPGAFTFTRTRKLFIWASEPVHLPHVYHASEGQIVSFQDGDPIVRCGLETYLRIIEMTDEAGNDPCLTGQVRFQPGLSLVRPVT